MMIRTALHCFCLGILPGLFVCQGRALPNEPAAGAKEENARSKTVSSGWIKSRNGSVSFRLLSSAKPIDKAKPIVLLGDIRNNTKNTIYLLKAFGDKYVAKCVNTQLDGPKGRIRYDGPIKTYSLGSSAFVRLAPGKTFRDRLELNVNHFSGSKLSGEYKIVYTYRMAKSHRDRAEQLLRKKNKKHPDEPKDPEPKIIVWSGGEIQCPAITVKKRSGISASKKARNRSR